MKQIRLKTDGTTTTLESSAGIIDPGQWTHVAATYDSSQMRIYKDGVEIASVAKSGAIDTAGSVEAALGNQPVGAGSEPFAGLLDDVCIYDRALDAAELSDIMSSGCGSGTVPPTATPTNTPAPPTATPPPGSDVARIQRITYTLSGKMIGVRVVELDASDVVLFDELTYMLTNHLGSVMAISDDAGNMVGDIIRHEPFGDYWGTPPDETNPNITDRGFTNQKHNNELKLIYYGARYYMPDINRFMSPDTIVPDPKNPQSFNRYSYALNNPINYTDPSDNIPIPFPVPCLPCIIGVNARAFWAINRSNIGRHEADLWQTLEVDPATRASPPTSSNVTGWLTNQMVTNSAESAPSIQAYWGSWNPHKKAAGALVFKDLVQTGGVWDFKGDIVRSGIASDKIVEIAGHRLNQQAVANIHYGFVGAASGFSWPVLAAAGGWAQWNDHPYWRSDTSWTDFYDQPFDAWSVDMGYLLYAQYHDRMDKLTPETFDSFIDWYIGTYGPPPEPDK